MASSHIRKLVGGLRRWDDEAKRFLRPSCHDGAAVGDRTVSRVKSIFQKRNNGVLEIDLLGGDYTRPLYFVALIDVAALDSAPFSRSSSAPVSR
jgi:hypothetical protein